MTELDAVKRYKRKISSSHHLVAMDNELETIKQTITENDTLTKGIISKLENMKDGLSHQYNVALEMIEQLRKKNLKSDMLLLDILHDYAELKEKYDTLVKKHTWVC